MKKRSGGLDIVHDGVSSSHPKAGLQNPIQRFDPTVAWMGAIKSVGQLLGKFCLVPLEILYK